MSFQRAASKREDYMTPPEDKETLEKKSKRYARTRHILSVLNLVLAFGFLVFMVLCLTIPVREFARGLADGYYQQLGVYYACFWLLMFVVGLPLDFYSGYILEHAYELSNQSFFGWARNELKGLGLGLAVTLPMVEAVYFVIRNYPEYWWVLAGVLFTLASVVLARIAPVLILPLFYKSTPIDDDKLREALVPLAEGAGVTLEGVYKIDLSKDTKKANAMLAGLGATRRVIFGDTLLSNFTIDEIAVVFAHELGHHVYRHIWKLLAMTSLVGFTGLFIAGRVLDGLAMGLGIGPAYDIATVPLLLIIVGVFGVIVVPLENYYSRMLEAQCDMYALEKTRNPDAFIGAMTKLAANNLADKDPSGIIEYLFYGHPPIAKRIEMARQWSEKAPERA
jgi:STE24 endopeptidase